MQNLSNTNLGQYALIEVIGRGRLSTVYKAYQPSLQRFVAIKVLHHLDMLGAQRFEREAQVIAQLHHPNILPIFDYGEQDDLRYFVTQYIEQSVTLNTLLVQQRMDYIAALHLIRHLLAGLAYAHSRGIIHRDIKPSNILLPLPTWPLLADFGIAKILDDLRQLTPPGQTVGTAAYIAPELARGLPADARSDLYSVGVVLYEIVTGQIPFDAVTPSAILHMHIYTEPPRPRSLNPEIPAELEALLLRALEKDQTARYQSAAAMIADVEQVVARLERERTLAELLGADSLAPSYTTRKLEPDAPPAEVIVRRSELKLSASDSASFGSLPRLLSGAGALRREGRARPTWRFGPSFIVVIAVGLISGMLAAHLLRSRAMQGNPAPEPTPVPATRTLTPGALGEQSLFATSTGFPANRQGSTGQIADPSTTMPLARELPPENVLAPGTASSTPAADDPDTPPTQPPVLTSEPSTEALTPQPPDQMPIETPAPPPSPGP